MLMFLSSCTSEGNNYYVVSARGDGLKIGSKILFKGTEIGQVKNVSIQNNRVLFELELESKYKMSKASKMWIENQNLFDSSIEMSNVNKRPFVLEKDTMFINLERKTIPIELVDSISRVLINKIEDGITN